MRKLVALLLCGALGGGCQRPSETAPPITPVATAPSDSSEPGGIGSLEARTAAGDPSQISLSSVHIAARQLGDMAEIEATHTFHNQGQSLLEGTFRFPMPDGALLTGLSMMIDGKMMEGELVEREKALKTYEAIVDGMQDPALLEWEHGSVFKMRVFPIEPGRDKVVTIRYLTPLRRNGDGLELVQAARSATGDGEVAALSIDWQGRRVFDEKHVAASRVVTVPAKPASAVLRETRPDGNYSVVRVSPDWKRVPRMQRAVPKNWFVVVDTSRSALEELPRQVDALRVVLAALPAGARFQALTSDLEARPAPQGLLAVTPAAIEQAVQFVQSTTPDGASDLGHTLQVVGGLVSAIPDSGLLYLGDCEPTWGTTRNEDLLALLPQALP
ncbi:MAG TPA: VIT and VWA domain-containing protein, partial [Polyangiaceae bacterium]|nr:VIT and VWA domain-containing protein [Polyangiaceae bacterium]